MNKETKLSPQSSVLSPDSDSVPSAPPVDQAAEARTKRDDLSEAARIIGVDVGNSREAIAQCIEQGRVDDIRRGLALMYDRLTRAHGLLSKHIKDLPTCSIVNLADSAPTA